MYITALAALLHDWERQFVERNGMRDIYEKMPFPFERRAQSRTGASPRIAGHKINLTAQAP